MAKLGPEDETVDLHFPTKHSIANGGECVETLCNQIFEGHFLYSWNKDLFNMWEKHCPLVLKLPRAGNNFRG